MNNLYIIGDGFDIAHKLDTQYWNFRTFLEEKYSANYYIDLNRDFFARLQSTNHVVIIGWSAGESDLPYLQVIKNAVQTDAHWTVYYYDQTAYNSLCNAMTESGISAKKLIIISPMIFGICRVAPGDNLTFFKTTNHRF